MTWLEFTIASLVVYRLSLMISKEAGPFWMFKLFRKKVKQHAPKQTHMDDGIECLWCVSQQFAIVFVVAGFFWVENTVFRLGCLALALSGVAIILNQAFTKGSK